MKNLSKVFLVVAMAFGLAACGTQNPMQTGYYNQNGQYVGPGGMIGGSTCITGVGGSLNFNFTASGVDDIQARFLAGNIPPQGAGAGQHGTVQLGGGYQNSMGAITMNKQGYNGSMQLYYSPSQRTASGMVQLSGTAVSQLLMQSMYSSGYGQYGQYGMNQNVCVTGVAMDVVYVANTYQNYGGYQQQSTGMIQAVILYLYLNNGQTAVSVGL